MKTYKVHYHDRDIIFEADRLDQLEARIVFYKNDNLMAIIPHSCPITVIKSV